MAPHIIRIAIVGFGPRGLGALEALLREAEPRKQSLAIELFDPAPWPAAGPNFSPDESEVCLLNLPLRAIDLPPPVTDAPSSFPDWVRPQGYDDEAFVPRALLGQYLNMRYAELAASLPAEVTLSHHAVQVTSASRDGGWHLHSGTSDYGPYDHVLLSVGQPETADDDQMAEWRDHAARHGLDLAHAYPGHALIAAADAWAGKTVAIRGLGLSALDVVGLLTQGLGGRFEDQRYIASGREPARIVPFSLDGHAPAPKPATAEIDARFDPLPAEDAAFRDALTTALVGPPDKALTTICTALEAPTLRILGETDPSAVRHWLQTERDEPGTQETRDTTATLRAHIAQAEGDTPSIGYTIGQLWRKWQPLLREGYLAAPVGPQTATALTDFDEGLKRYSYGAPVATLRHLLTLIETGLVDPRAADAPDITATAQGWRLHEDDTTLTAAIMIDSVLPAAALPPVSDPLIEALKTTHLTALADDLGARTTPEGAATTPEGTRIKGLWLAGRLANGSVIAADSIHDCFGIVPRRWARAVLAP